MKSLPDGPWNDHWEVVEPLDQGGQGITWLVRDKSSSDTPPAVLKILKHQNSPDARGRMYQEVGNLILLSSRGVRVPRVIEHNKEDFEKDVPLYFIMDFISGMTIARLISHGRLTFEVAITLALDICNTLGLAHAHNVQHRDLKPENIIVRNTEKAECVLLDFGLSFNEDAEQNLTHTGVRFDNKFLSLPERRVLGGDRRDPRSDITGVVALLYFCLTGYIPGDLQDEKRRPPHRRPSYGIRDCLGKLTAMDQLEVFFDRGFAQDIESRFQSCQELDLRLKALLKSPDETPQVPVVNAHQL
jgi:serine/threonine-protein kinase